MSKFDESSHTWLQLSAGAAIVDTLERALHGFAFDPMEYSSARAELAKVTDLTAYRRLRTILELSTPEMRSWDTWRDVAGAKLMAYGIVLKEEGHYAPAVAVFQVLLGRGIADEDLRIAATKYSAWSLRLLSKFPDAESFYAQLESMGRSRKDYRTVLEARLGRAYVDIERGDVGAGEVIARRVARSARASKFSDIRANALITLAATSGIRRRADRVLKYSRKALPLILGSDGRERTLVNMASAFRELDCAANAKRIAERVAAGGKSADQRIMARILLHNLAVDAGDRAMSAHHRRALLRESLTPRTKTEFLESCAREFAMRRDFNTATRFARQMLASAEEHRINELIIRADAAIDSMTRGEIPAVYEFRPVVPETITAGQLRATAEEALEHCPAADERKSATQRDSERVGAGET